MVSLGRGQPRGNNRRPRLKTILRSSDLLIEPRNKFGLSQLLDTREFGFGYLDQSRCFIDSPLSIGRLVLEVRLRRAAGGTGFINAVEVGRQAVVIVLRNRVELVVVTLRAAQRESQKNRARRIHAVKHVVDSRLFLITPALAVVHVVAVKTRRQNLLGCRAGQQIARELLDRKFIERFVLIETVNHPVSPRPVGTSGVCLEAVRVAVPSPVEPPHRHPLAEMRRCQQLIDQAIPVLRRWRLRKTLHQIRLGRQAGQVERKPPNQRMSRGLIRQFKLRLGQSLLDKEIDRVRAVDRNRRSFRFHERPVLAPRSTLSNPFCQDFDRLPVQRLLVRISGRHDQVGIGRGHAFQEGTFFRLARNNHCIAASIFGGGLALVQPQLTFSRALIKPVTGETVVRNDRSDVTIEIDVARRHGPRVRCKNKHNKTETETVKLHDKVRTS